MEKQLKKYFKNLTQPNPSSHKGQNGKLMIIGGSELFHAASKWSLDIASKFVDMVFYSSVPSNNELIKEAKANFWNGIVVDRQEMTDYLEESDVILIGPGMKRDEETSKLTNQLISDHPDKKWVIDAGALQVVDPDLIPSKTIITPHHQEMARLEKKNSKVKDELLERGVVILLKGPVDTIYMGGEKLEIKGGNAGMTKGGTGDVLAGLVSALYCTNDALSSAVIASYINKKAAENLHQESGPYFNASDLVGEVPKTFWQTFQDF